MILERNDLLAITRFGGSHTNVTAPQETSISRCFKRSPLLPNTNFSGIRMFDEHAKISATRPLSNFPFPNLATHGLKNVSPDQPGALNSATY